MKEKEPWRIDKNSVHFKLLKGWLSRRFKKWLAKTSEKHELSGEELLIRVIETIRRINWRVLQILKERTGKEVDMPFIIISDSPADFAMFTYAFINNYSPNIFCSRLRVIKNLDPEEVTLFDKERKIQRLREANSEPRVVGKADGLGMSLYDLLIMRFFDSGKFGVYYRVFREAITEEAFHYFCSRTGEFRDREMTQEIIEVRIRRDLDDSAKEKITQEIEEKYGVKQTVAELIQILEQEKEDLFSLLPPNK